MADRSVIPEKLLIPMLEQWRCGMTGEKLVVWLKDNHGILTSVRVVNRRLKIIKDIELQAKKEAIAKRASEQALDYVQMMDDKILKLNKINDELLKTNDLSNLQLAKNLLEIQLKYIDKQMNLTGMDKDEPASFNEDILIDGLIKKINV